MKLHAVKGHFREDGLKWVPKRPFKSIKEIKRAQLYSARWEYYECDFCGKFHVADKSKKEEYDNNR